MIDYDVGVKLNSRLLAVSVILCIVTLAFAGVSQAQTINSGLTGGMTFFYYVSSYCSSTDDSYSVPLDLLVVNQTSCIQVSISSVNATSVDTVTMCYYIDGTADLDRGGTNLYTGVGYGFVGIIGANLTVGDRIHPDGEDTLTILDTATRNYESGARITNHVRIADYNPEDGYKATRDLYFDKATGILVEQVDQVEATIAPYVTTRLTWKIASVSGVDGWEIPGFTLPVASTTPTPWSRIDYKILLVIVLFILVVLGIVIVVYKKKLTKPATTTI
jgi:hypothetical protein